MKTSTSTSWTGLDDATAAWLRDAVDGTVTDVRGIAGGGQRKTFFVSVDGKETRHEYVLQATSSGGPYDGKGITSLAREAALFRMLHTTDAAAITPRLVAVHPDATAILTERAPGGSEFDALDDPSQKKALLEDFVSALVRLHAVDAREAREVGFSPLDGPTGAASARVAVWDGMFRHVRRPSPLVRFALRWLRDHAPETAGPHVICHGDVGPGNFLFEGNRVTKLVDWELAHLGDYHDDLGMLSLRAFQLRSMGDLNGMLALYSRLSGRPVDGWKVRYYRAVALILGTVTSLVQLDNAIATERPLIAMPLYLHLVPGLQLWLAEALLDLGGLTPETIPLPGADVDIETLDVALALNGASEALAALGRSGGQAGFPDLVRHLDAVARYGGPVKAAELEDLEQLLGRRPADIQEGRAALDKRLADGKLDEAALLRWSWRSAKRQTLLWPAWRARYEMPLIPIQV